MNKSVTIIPAIQRVGNNVKIDDKPRLKVAAYCRVSTDSDEQATSYDAQVEHYTEFIKNNTEWELAGIYADDGISGTNTKKREDFNRMIDDCNNGKIDMIITKSISRFARNTLDCLRYIRELKDKNIPVFFEKENINTMDSKGEVLLTIMASLAQQESQSLSQNIKLGLQFRYQNGEMTINHNRFMGYTKDKDGNLIIDENQAVIVRRIYREYLEGKSLALIGKGLEADGVLTGAGKKRWRSETILKMLCNEKYIGDALLQKTYTVDFLTKKRVKNDGLVPQYYVENSHPSIIPRDLFKQVQQEMARRSTMKAGNKRRVFSSRYALSSLVYCSKCGNIYRRVAWNNRGKRSDVWRCCTRVEKGPGACDAETIPEDELQMVTVEAFKHLYERKNSTLETLMKNIAMVVDTSGGSLVEIDEKLTELQKEILKKVNSKQNHDSLAQEILALREKKQNIMAENGEKQFLKQRIVELEDFLHGFDFELTEYDERLVRSYIKKMVVFHDRYEVEFKAGIKVEIAR